MCVYTRAYDGITIEFLMIVISCLVILDEA